MGAAMNSRDKMPDSLTAAISEWWKNNGEKACPQREVMRDGKPGALEWTVILVREAGYGLMRLVEGLFQMVLVLLLALMLVVSLARNGVSKPDSAGTKGADAKAEKPGESAGKPEAGGNAVSEVPPKVPATRADNKPAARSPTKPGNAAPHSRAGNASAQRGQ